MPKTCLSSANCIVLPLHFSTQEQALFILKVACKTRNQWKYNIDSEILILLNCLDYSQVKCISYFILYCWWICSRWDKELIFDIDIAFCLRYKLKIWNMDAELSIARMTTNWPITNWSYDLALIMTLLYVLTIISCLIHLRTELFFFIRLNLGLILSQNR
jgi:hypothetical protein